jgi:DNA-binding transcriptional regulator GbsR (MarR family)
MQKPGRRRLYPEVAMDVYYVRLTATLARHARKIGQGNLSEGIREALEHCEKCPEAQSDMEKK